MDYLIRMFQTLVPFLFVLGVLIFVHELGHFLVARWYRVKILAFSLGFGPKLLKVKRGETEYCISAIPLGGYVKLGGEEAGTGDPTDFMSQSKWVRIQVYLAGPIMNILLAIILTAGILSQGADVPLYRSAQPVIGNVEADGAGAKAGLMTGDRVVRVNGKDVATWDDFDFLVASKANRELDLVVERSGSYKDIVVIPEAVGDFDMGDLKVWPVLRPQVLEVMPDQPAAKAGFKNHDVILTVGGQRPKTREDVVGQIQKHADKPLVFQVERAGAPMDITVVPELRGKVGVVGLSIANYETRRVDPNIFTAFRMSLSQNWESAQIITTTLAGLFTTETPVNNLVGPVGIAQMSGQTAKLGWLPLLALMSMISLQLGLLNLMPIPVLDGGHITIILLEGIARRDFSVKLKERILFAGFALILMLMVTVIFNDVTRIFR
jgi:regulator of sigma E protease